MSRAALLVAVFLDCAIGQGPVDLQSDLAGLVDQPTEAARQKVVDSLAARKDVALGHWLEAMCEFGDFESIDAGLHRYSAELHVGSKSEATELHIYVPSGYDPGKPAPLLLFGHGSGGNGNDGHALWQSAANQIGMVVLSPSEVKEHGGWAFTERERQSALAALRWTRRKINVDENRVFVGGISRGGHMTWDLILRHPDSFAAGAPFIGGPRLNIAGGQNNLRYLENVAHLPIRDLQGSRDDPLLLANLHLAFDRLTKLGASDAELVEFPELGHGYDFTAVDWAGFLGKVRRDPVPERVVRMAATTEQARSFWVEILAFDRGVAEEFPLRVDGRKWDGLDESGRRAYLNDLAVERTARIEVSRPGPGRFAATGQGVRRFRLLLTEAMLDDKGGAVVRFKGRSKRKKPKLDKRVLLREFGERFDRTFLPLAEMVVQ